MRTLLEISRELASLAQAGLTYTRDPFDRERFTRLRDIASELLHAPGQAPLFRWPEELGYPTPKVDVRAAVFQDDTVLLVKETASQLWTLPGGWADNDLTPAENAERECLEETGYIVKARALVSLIDRDRAGYPKNAHCIYKLFFLCERLGGAAATSLESSEVAFHPVLELPPLDPDRARREDILRAYQFHLEPGRPAHFH